ncbi:hypothetical protein LCGC14_3090420 [marine sediment metagenome]|uniref:Uncharacterized protein n=1 Tax=marine sediment metagenome TaxID=412755 RepID=A0A0F8WAS6_9ZZZZ
MNFSEYYNRWVKPYVPDKGDNLLECEGQLRQLLQAEISDAKFKQAENFEIIRKESIKTAKIVGNREGKKAERERLIKIMYDYGQICEEELKCDNCRKMLEEIHSRED